MGNLELTMAITGFTSSSSSGVIAYGNMKDIDINQPAQGLGEFLGSADEDVEEDETATATATAGGDGGPPKKLRLSTEQCWLLEESFRQNHTLNPKQKEALAMKLKLRTRQVEVWFQNGRARAKLKQTEKECAYLRRCFGSLTEENHCLHKEVEELRALQVSPPPVLSLHTGQPMPDASSLTMCPQCQRITATNNATRHLHQRPGHL